MNRYSFIRNLMALGVGAKLPARLLSYKKLYLLECFVAGFRFYSGPSQLNKMQAGSLLELRREPENPYDSCAIAIYHNLHKIGFIPAGENKVLSRLIDAEVMPLVAEITHLEPAAAKWENVRIAVYMLKEQRGPLAHHAAYLTQLSQPVYHTLASKKQKDWYKILEQERKTNGFYDLWYSHGPGFEAPTETHNNDFIVVRTSKLPEKLASKYHQDVSQGHIDIADNAATDYVVLKTGHLTDNIEAAEAINEVYDANKDNYLELVFERTK